MANNRTDRVEKKSVPKKGRYNFLIDASVYGEFSGLCEELSLVRSKNIENHMKEFIRKQGDEKK